MTGLGQTVVVVRCEEIAAQVDLLRDIAETLRRSGNVRHKKIAQRLGEMAGAILSMHDMEEVVLQGGKLEVRAKQEALKVMLPGTVQVAAQYVGDLELEEQEHAPAHE